MRFFQTLRSPRGQLVVVFVIFGILALFAYWPVYPGDPSQMTNCGCGDVAQSVWYMEWGPYAIFHGLNPLRTSIINYPVGSNLAISAEMFGLSLPLAPLTYLVSPVATFNFAMWLAFPLAATTCFYVLRRWTKHSVAAFVGGLLYGFSAYTFGEGATHLNLSFIAFVPLLYMAIFELFVRQRNVVKWGVLLGIFSIWQYFISSEIFLDTVVVAVLALVVVAIRYPRLALQHLRRAAPAVAISVVMFGIVAGYPIWYSLFGPQHLNYPIQGSVNPFNTDLIGPYTPTMMERLYPASLKSVGTSLVDGDWTENGAFLGVPLILAWLYIAFRKRRNRWIQFSFVMTIIVFILSLGPTLTIHGRTTTIELPFALVKHRPIFDNVLPSRFSMEVTFFVILTLAIGFDALFTRRPSNSALPTAEASVRMGGTVRFIPGVCVLLLIAASLLPTWPYPSFSTQVATPFNFPSIAKLKPSSVVLTYPYPVVIDNQPMVWQATSGMKFQLLGGYNLFTFPNGTGSAYPADLRPLIVQIDLEDLADPQFTFPPTPVPNPSALTPHLLRRFIRDNHVQVVIVALAAKNANRVESLLVRALHRSPLVQSGEATWILH